MSILGLSNRLVGDRLGRLDVHILDTQYLTWLFLSTDLVRINACICNNDLFDSGMAILMLWLGSFGFLSGFDLLLRQLDDLFITVEEQRHVEWSLLRWELLSVLAYLALIKLIPELDRRSLGQVSFLLIILEQLKGRHVDSLTIFMCVYHSSVILTQLQ